MNCLLDAYLVQFEPFSATYTQLGDALFALCKNVLQKLLASANFSGKLCTFVQLMCNEGC